jgi:hypothetical protein
LSQTESTRYHKIGYAGEKIDRLLVDLFLESHARRPQRIVLDLDSTDIPLHGHQEARFFHGYDDSYCYLPLYIFAGDQLLCARLRPADQDGAAGAVDAYPFAQKPECIDGFRFSARSVTMTSGCRSTGQHRADHPSPEIAR